MSDKFDIDNEDDDLAVVQDREAEVHPLLLFDALSESKELVARLKERQEFSGVSLGDEPLDNKREAKVIENVRQYQMEIFNGAVASNAVCMLGTGLGKTFIAVMVVKEMLRLHPTSKAMILCPTAFLVDQQAGVFASNTPYSVYSIHGGQQNPWNEQRWADVWPNTQVLVATPQVLVNALSHAYITLSTVSVIVVDECHHARGTEHPMAQLLSRVRELPKDKWPRVLGLTASPLMTAPSDLTQAILKFEFDMCDARLISADVSGFYNPPKEQTYCFNSVHFVPPLHIQEKIFGRTEDKDLTMFKKICLRVLHLWFNVGSRAARRHLLHLRSRAAWNIKYDEDMPKAFDALGIRGYAAILSFEGDEDVPGDYLCPKLVRLLDILKRCLLSKEQVLVFVEQREVAVQMSIEVSKRLGITCDWLVGVTGNNRNELMAIMLKKFRKFKRGGIQVLIATAAAEEGIDVPSVSSVISYDGVRTVKSYVQMRGRCRFSQSQYIIFNSDRNDTARYLEAVKTESDIFQWIAHRPEGIKLDPSLFFEEGADEECVFQCFYKVDATGAYADQRSVVSILFRFCQTLGGVSDDSLMMDIKTSEHGLLQGTMTLPNALPFDLRVYTSSERLSKKDVKRELCFEAVKALHGAGWLTDRLLPVSALSILGKDGDDKDDDVEFPEITQEEKEKSAFILDRAPPVNKQERDVMKEEFAQIHLALTAPPVEEIRCKLLKSDKPRTYLIRLGDGHPLKVRMEVDSLGKEELSIPYNEVDHHCYIERELFGEEARFSDLEMRFNECIWGFMNPIDPVNGRVLIALTDQEAMQRTLDEYEKVLLLRKDPSKLFVAYASDPDWVWESKLHEGKYSTFVKESTYKLSDTVPNQSTSFRAFFENSNLFSPSPELAEQPIVEVFYGKEFKPTHYIRHEHKPSRMLLVPRFALIHSHVTVRLYLSLTLLPTYVRTVRLRSMARIVISRLWSTEPEEIERMLPMVQQAISPISAHQSSHLETFECLGDSVLKLFITRRLHEEFSYDEGRLSQLRGYIIGNAKLAHVFKHGPLQGCVDPRPPTLWFGIGDEVVLPMKGAADVVEAVLGAIFLACGKSVQAAERLAYSLGIFSNFPRPFLSTQMKSNMDNSKVSIPPSLEPLQDVLGWKFKNPALLVEAMTHASDSRSLTRNYNRLEFLGDAVVDLCSILSALSHNSSMSPAELSDWRYICACSETLGLISKRLGLNKYISHFSATLTRELDNYVNMLESPSVWLDTAPKPMADVFESCLGAIFVDSEYDVDVALDVAFRLTKPVWSVLTPNPILEPYREVRELYGPHVPLQFRQETMSLTTLGVLITRHYQTVPNWQRIISWKAVQMFKANPEVEVELRNLAEWHIRKKKREAKDVFVLQTKDDVVGIDPASLSVPLDSWTMLLEDKVKINALDQPVLFNINPPPDPSAVQGNPPVAVAAAAAAVVAAAAAEPLTNDTPVPVVDMSPVSATVEPLAAENKPIETESETPDLPGVLFEGNVFDDIDDADVEVDDSNQLDVYHGEDLEEELLTGIAPSGTSVAAKKTKPATLLSLRRKLMLEAVNPMSVPKHKKKNRTVNVSYVRKLEDGTLELAPPERLSFHDAKTNAGGGGFEERDNPRNRVNQNYPDGRKERNRREDKPKDARKEDKPRRQEGDNRRKGRSGDDRSGKKSSDEPRRDRRVREESPNEQRRERREDGRRERKSPYEPRRDRRLRDESDRKSPNEPERERRVREEAFFEELRSTRPEQAKGDVLTKHDIRGSTKEKLQSSPQKAEIFNLATDFSDSLNAFRSDSDNILGFDLGRAFPGKELEPRQSSSLLDLISKPVAAPSNNNTFKLYDPGLVSSNNTNNNTFKLYDPGLSSSNNTNNNNNNNNTTTIPSNNNSSASSRVVRVNFPTLEGAVGAAPFVPAVAPSRHVVRSDVRVNFPTMRESAPAVPSPKPVEQPRLYDPSKPLVPPAIAEKQAPSPEKPQSRIIRPTLPVAKEPAPAARRPSPAKKEEPTKAPAFKILKRGQDVPDSLRKKE